MSWCGVKLIQSHEQLSEYLRRFPVQARFLLQQKAPYSAEAGIFYVRFPGDAQGQIISMTLKYAPSVMGDGVRTARELISLTRELDNWRTSIYHATLTSWTG